MNKSRLLAFVFLVVFFSSSVLATDVAYILKNPSNPNYDLIGAIEDLGYSYKLVDDDNILATDFSEYEMLLIWDEILKNTREIPVNQKKSLVANTYYLDDWGIADYTGSLVSSGYLSGRILENNMITSGLASPIQLYSTRGIVLYHLPYAYKRAGGLENVVSTDNYNEYPVIGLINPGGALYPKGSGSAAERTIFFGITETNYWTSGSEQLFKNSLRWVLTGEDADDDGYHYDEDCDDSNPEAWQIFSGYLDFDLDGFGSGSLIEICAGEEFPEGYSLINDDCDDLAFEVNPNATEILYDGIDQDCEGYDIVDFDGDGYVVDCNFVDGVCDISGGDDCDDSDSEFNPGSENIYKNCENDAPTVMGIQKIIVRETENVVIEVYATDPENDVLDYSINDSIFAQEENVFSWTTGYADYGTYFFTISVSDGVLSTEVEVEVEIRNLNQNPVCEEIPLQEWPEDNPYSFNLNSYCNDPDGEMINFYFSETSSQEQIFLESIENGIVNFSVQENWNGEDWIIFIVSDGKSEVLTNKIVLNVTPVNDAPIFSGNIGDIEWNEDTNLDDYFDLNDYFSDVDGDNLEYEVLGNHFIDVVIRGRVSFYPDANWNGYETIVFSASDGSGMIYSNGVTLTVFDTNEPPQFEEMDCNTNILEDIGESCIINFSDFESDEVSFSIVNENKINCEVDGLTLNYISVKDYNGPASCLIRVSDGYSYADYLLGVSVLPVNDAPVINSYSPQGVLRIVENTSRLFSVSVSDIDSSFGISWLIDGVKEGIGNNYNFIKGKGSYDLEVVATDGEFNASHLWDVFVGDISDFTCSEVGGDICTEDEVCLGGFLGVSDSSGCCSIACSQKPPEFKDIKNRCEIINQAIVIEIKEPDAGDEYFPGDEFELKLKIKNNADEDLDFDVEAYFYDITEDDSIEEDEDSLAVDEGKSETLEFKFKVPEDLEDKNNYAVFVRVFDDEEYCNENFVLMDINRKKHDVIIDNFKIDPENAVCGDFLSVDVNIKNIGKSDEEVYLILENSALEIHEETEKFEIEEYGKDDEEEISFSVRVPKDAEGGIYLLKARVVFEDGSFSKESELVLENCKKMGIVSLEVEAINLGTINSNVKQEKSDTGGGITNWIIVVGISIILIVGSFGVVRIGRRRKLNKY